MHFNHPGIKLEPTLGTLEDKIEHLPSYAHVVHTTEKQVIVSRRRKNENVFKMSKDKKCTCKACKNPVFHCQICKFGGFLMPSSSWLLKLPIICSRRWRIVGAYGNLKYLKCGIFRPAFLPISKIEILFHRKREKNARMVVKIIN